MGCCESQRRGFQGPENKEDHAVWHPVGADLCPWPPLKLGWHFDWPWPVLLAFMWVSGIEPWDLNSGAHVSAAGGSHPGPDIPASAAVLPLTSSHVSRGAEIKTFSASNPNIILTLSYIC